MNVMYKSTRGDSKLLTASQAVIQGLAEDGGLFVPVEVPKLSCSLEDLKGKNYKEIAYIVLKEFFTDYTEEELKNCIEKAYDSKFDTKEIAPLVKKNNQYFLELFHGPTIAFKDMALSILPHLLTTALKKNNSNEKVVILTATSGDTGKAALEAFSDVENTNIIVFYPHGGVSRIQELQMVTTKGKNTKVISVEGNFDDCQSAVKRMFHDDKLKAELLEKGYKFSSANSINIGRLFPQVAYYVFSYAKLMDFGEIKSGDIVNFTVPTGNFGNILAAYYAKQMGIPIGKLVCASNENKVLFDFFNTGVYDRNRKFILTSSPSMDILISSNLERLIYHICGDNADMNAKLMKDLSEKGIYSIDEKQKMRLEDFDGEYSGEEAVFETICKYYKEASYVIDTHTAVAACADINYKKKTADNTPSVVVSTASPYKFTRNVMKAISPDFVKEDDFEMVDKLEELSGVSIPAAIKEIRDAKILHDTLCTVEEMETEVKKYLGL